MLFLLLLLSLLVITMIALDPLTVILSGAKNLTSTAGVRQVLFV